MSDCQKKRFRQASLHDFIHIQKMPKNKEDISSSHATDNQQAASNSSDLPLISLTDTETYTSTEEIDSNGTKTGPTDAEAIETSEDTADNNNTKIKLNDTQSSGDLFPSESSNDSETPSKEPRKTKQEKREEKVMKKKLGSKLAYELYVSDSWNSIETTSEEPPSTYDSLKRYTQVSPSLPPLQPASDHSVLFNYNTITGKVPHPYPEQYRDKWDNSYVRLPCSPQSLYPVKNALTGDVELQQRWEIIQTTLCNPIHSSIDLEEVILTFNSQYASRWDFHCLHQLFTEVYEPYETRQFFDNVLPKMVELCVQLPKICTQPIPLLTSGQTHKITLSQKQIASLLANAFFCTFPRRNTQSRNSEYNSFPSINFSSLFAQGGRQNKAEKLKCLVNYFKRVTEEEPTGTITFHRQSVTEFPVWKESDKLLPRLCVQSKGLIEVDGMGMLQVDFANKFVGGGALKSGCVQEEIRFFICPELIVSRLFTERLNKNEALIITGCEQFNQYSGYSDSFRWEGNFEDCMPRDSWGRKVTQIVAIDALRFTRTQEQYNPELIQRELEKAYAGFLNAEKTDFLPAVATGNWGCGAFRGDPRLKSLLQLMSAAETGRDVLYLTFNDEQLESDLKKMYILLKKRNTTVGQLAQTLDAFHEQTDKTWLFSFLFQRISDSQSDTE